MREVLSVAAEWARSSVPFALATLVGVRGSSPRELGASMVVSADGRVFGNVSGGCVEGAVFTECVDAMDSAAPSLHTYGISGDDIAAIGLTCGGIVDVLVRPVPPGSPAARALLLAAEREAAGLPVALALVTASRPAGDVASRRSGRSRTPAGGDAAVGRPGGAEGFGGSGGFGGFGGSGGFGESEVGEGASDALSVGDLIVLTGDTPPTRDRTIAETTAVLGGDRAALLHLDGAGCRVPAPEADLSLLVVPFGSAPRLTIVGAVEFSVALARLGTALGFAVTVVDPRDVFASAERFPEAEVVVDWPDRYLARARLDPRTAVCVLSHDPRVDVPALRVALASPAGYVGAMGSRRTHDDRLRRLSEAGVAASDIARLRSPIGLDLGGRGPDETALSILAEIVALRHGATGRPHSELSGAVHEPARAAAAQPSS